MVQNTFTKYKNIIEDCSSVNKILFINIDYTDGINC